MDVAMDTTTLSFPSTAVAIRETTTSSHSQTRKNVCAEQTQSRDLNYCGLKTSAKIYKTNCCGTNCDVMCGKRSVQE